jgi:hypothetical protein
MILQYFPIDKIVIDGIILKFQEKRQSVREKLAREFEEDDQIIPLSDSETLYQQRDIYKGESSAENFYFLNYDRNGLLCEVEVHRCDRIEVMGHWFDFNDDLDSIALVLSKNTEISIISEGEYFFKGLKLVLRDRRSTGGEGTTLGYFYCASDITHLDDK